MEVDVEVDAEVVQGLLDVREHQFDADGAEGFLLLVGRQIHDVGTLLQNRGGDVGDVRAGVTVFGSRFTLRCSDQRTREAVDLGTVIVEVVLTCYQTTLRGQNASERVSDCGPTVPPR